MKGLILAAGKADDSISQVFGDIPGALVPVNGTPLLQHIVNEYINQNIEEIFIAVGYKSEKIEELFKNQDKYTGKIKLIPVSSVKKPGNTLIECLSQIPDSKLVINLGDTLVKPYPDLKQYSNTIFSSPNYDRTANWCIIETDNNSKIISFIDKKETTFDLDAIVGIYVIEHRLSILNKFKSSNKKKLIEISDYLNYFKRFEPLKAIAVENWLDFGHLNLYQRSKKKHLQSRFFNTLSFDDLRGTITKKSDNDEKLSSEIEWLLNIPKSLNVFFPRIIDYSLRDEIFVTMEYYSYPSLSEIWLFSSFKESVFFGVIDKLFLILDNFKIEKRKVSEFDYHSIYDSKTRKRMNEFIGSNVLPGVLLEKETININGKDYLNWNKIEEIIFIKTKELYNEDHNCVIHGDFCFSNILTEITSGVIRLVDPRGKWSQDGAGDIKYDLAKLSHSINGYYDFIVNDLFDLKYNTTTISYKIYYQEKHQNICKYFDQKVSLQYPLHQIRLIEGLLFLSMLPLHNDNPRRQILMYCRAIEILNKVINEKKEINYI